MNSEKRKTLIKLAVSIVIIAAVLLSLSAVQNSKGPVVATGVGQGIEGDVVVRIEADADQIYSVTVVEHHETEGIGTVAVEKLPGRIVETQSLQVDAVTGCTVTSKAILDGVRAALAAGGISAAKFDVPPKAVSAANKTQKTLDCDVVIVGAGGAGLTAAAQASEMGAKVIVLEKMPLVGGNSLKATGGMNAAGTKHQQTPDLLDNTVEEFIKDTIAGGHDLNDPALVTVMAENSSDAIDWLESIGAPLPLIAPTGGTGNKYLHEPEDGSAVGPFLVEKLNAQCEKLGIEVHLETKATEIIMKDGKAAGVMAEGPDAVYTINAGAVILATGGFGANYELMTSFDPALAGAVTTNHSGATGDGILMAQAVGADTVDMEQIQLHPTVYQETGLLVSESLRSHGAILVNSSGKRFTNDMSTRDAVSQAELKQDGSYAYIIFDNRIRTTLSSTDKYEKNGLTVSADTYEGLAKEMGLSGDAVANFVATMEGWNKAVAAGEDKEFGRDSGSMEHDLSEAPYYAIKIAPGIHHTMGGLRIDVEARVLDTTGAPIPGLFAAGETTGGVHGGNRIGGNAVCDFVVFGRIAGKSAHDFACK